MKPPTIRVSLAFATTPDDTLITFCRNVYALIYGLTAFPDLPVQASVLLPAIEAFSDAKAAQPNGGKAGTAEKNNKREDLLVLMRKMALYVQSASDNNLALLLSTGFLAVSQNRTQYPLAKPAIVRIVAGMSGTSRVTLSTQSISRGCEIRVAEVGPDGTPGEFRPVQYSTSSRNIVIGGLEPGKLYTYQGRTMGGTTLYSDWSDQLVQRAV